MVLGMKNSRILGEYSLMRDTVVLNVYRGTREFFDFLENFSRNVGQYGFSPFRITLESNYPWRVFTFLDETYSRPYIVRTQYRLTGVQEYDISPLG